MMNASNLVPLVALLSILACGRTSDTKEPNSGGGGTDAGDGDDDSSGGASTAGGSGASGGEQALGGGSGGGGDDWDDLQFEVTNDTGSHYWLMTSGYECLNAEILSCEGCEAANVRDPAEQCPSDGTCDVESVGTFVRVDPNEVLTIEVPGGPWLDDLGDPRVVLGFGFNDELDTCMTHECLGGTRNTGQDYVVEELCRGVASNPLPFDPDSSMPVTLSVSELLP